MRRFFPGWSSDTGPADLLIGLGDHEPFLLRLAQAIYWCESRASATDPKHSLRTEDRRPAMLLPDRASVVTSALYHRSSSVPRDLVPVGSAAELRRGRLLVYYPDLDLTDGAAEVESRGFFDVSNTPPWETWVGLFHQNRPAADSSRSAYLVSWVPSVLVPDAQSGIEVNPEECIMWLDQVETPLRAELRLRGILS